MVGSGRAPAPRESLSNGGWGAQSRSLTRGPEPHLEPNTFRSLKAPLEGRVSPRRREFGCGTQTEQVAIGFASSSVLRIAVGLRAEYGL